MVSPWVQLEDAEGRLSLIGAGVWMPPELFGEAGEDDVRLAVDERMTFMYCEFACIVEDAAGHDAARAPAGVHPPDRATCPAAAARLLIAGIRRFGGEMGAAPVWVFATDANLETRRGLATPGRRPAPDP